MQRPTNLKINDQFRVIKRSPFFNVGDTILLSEDDGSDYPYFWLNSDKPSYHSIHFSNLEPYTKTIRDAQVGDVVVDEYGEERMVLERLQNIVLLSQANDFKKTLSNIYHFDQLEEYFTLKDAPEVVDDKTAEAMKVLKEAGYTITKD